MKQLKILTWHIHGNYLYYLSRCPCTFYLPVKAGRPDGYGGRAGTLPWPENLIEIPAERVRETELDIILCQSRRNYEVDRFEILAPSQLDLPQVFLEHDPPRENPTDTRHPAADADVTIVHVTPFNALMWDNGASRVRVVEHGVIVPPDVRYTGELARGIVVVNNLVKRGRRLGRDIFEAVRQTVPLDLVGINSTDAGGIGEIPYSQLPAFVSRYRFLFNPIRYTSLGLAVCEAMMVGAPIVALATTEMATVIHNGFNGFADTNPAAVMLFMKELLADRSLAERLGEGARATAIERFGIERFVRDWREVFDEAAARRSSSTQLTSASA